MKLISYARALCLAFAVATAGTLATVPVTSVAVLADEASSLKEVFALLKENRETARKIAMRLGIPSSSTVPGSGEQPEMNNALVIRNQHLFAQIAQKLGVETVIYVPSGGTLIEQNNQMLMQNRTITRSILSALGIAPPAAAPPMTGTLVEKNVAILTANKAALALISEKLGVK